MALKRSRLIGSIVGVSIIMLTVGFFVGTKVEADTQALHVARLTDRPYGQIISRPVGMWVREVKNILRGDQ